MARVEVKVPQLSESVATATLAACHVKVGDIVKRDQNMIDIETDKVVLELPAPQAGVVVEMMKSNGSNVVSGEVIAIIDTSQTMVNQVSSTKASPVSSAVEPFTPPMREGATMGHIAMPAAAKILAENQMTTADVTGTGKGGRVTKGDVLGALAKSSTLPNVLESVPTSSALSLDGRTQERVPMSRLRVRIAERLLQSQSTNAILTTFNEVNMKAIIDLRARYKEKFEKEHGVKLGFMSFFVKAAVAALKKFPIINASVDGHDIIYHGYFDIGIAVSSPRGLVVPILRNADQLSIIGIEKAVSECALKAKEGKLTLEDLNGGTFSISNGGTFGSMLSTPIINPPQSAILGIHATKERPVAENGQIVIRPMNYLALSYDHRIIDGREAVLSLVAIKEALEDPARLLLDL